MSEETSMFELLKERLTEEEIIKITCDYDNKFNELEEENKQLKSQLQQKEDIIKEVREEIKILESNCDISNYHAQKLYQTLDKEGTN